MKRVMSGSDDQDEITNYHYKMRANETTSTNLN